MANKTISSHDLFMQQAPNFNFEKSEEELVRHGLDVGYIKRVEGDDKLFIINENYGIKNS